MKKPKFRQVLRIINHYVVFFLLVAFVISVIVIRFLMGYIKKNDFKVFGWYRIILGVIVLLCGFAGFIG